MGRLASSLLLAAALLCSPPAGAQDSGSERPAEVLTVDGQPSPWDAYAGWLVERRGEAFLRGFLQRHLVLHAARRAQLEPGQEAIDARVRADIAARVDGAFHGDEAAWRRELERLGIAPDLHLAQLAEEARHSLCAAALLSRSRAVEPAQIETLFERRYGRGGRRLSLRTLGLPVVVATPASGQISPEQRRRAEAEARALREAELEALRARALGGEDFADLVREFAQGPEGHTAPEPRPFDPARWPTALLDALYALDVGAISPPLAGRGHVCLFQIVDEEHTELESVRAELARELSQRDADAAEASQLHARLLEEASVEVLPALWSGSADMNEAVLRIDGEDVPRLSLARQLVLHEGAAQASRFAQEQVVAQVAAEAGIESDPDQARRIARFEVDTAIERFHHGDVERWRQTLARRGRDEASALRERAAYARADLLVDGLLTQQREVDPEDLRRLWEQRTGPQGAVLELRQIVRSLALPPEVRGLDLAAQRQAQVERNKVVSAELEAVGQRLDAGEDFAALARELSEDHASASAGGALPGGPHWETLPDVVRARLLALTPGERSEPLVVGSTLRIYELLSRRDIPLASIEEELRAELLARRPSAAQRTTFLARLMQGHTWKLHIQALLAGAR